jgi:hypothetical protein
MFGMSVNEVPGWLVAMAPRAIGVPVAATPGLVPHVEVATVPALAELAALDDVAGALELELLLVLLLVLLLQPAAAIAMAAASTIVLRADSSFGAGICALISPPLRW